MTPLNIAVAGSTGRMGRAIMETIAEADDLRLSAALEQPGNPYLSQDAGSLTGTPPGRCHALPHVVNWVSEW